MELHQLRYFLAVAETGSFSRAAQRCRVAQPSLSQQIGKLEKQLGYRLFDRLPRGAVLTDAGTALLPRARRVLAEINAAQSAIEEDLDTGRGPLVVGAIPTIAPFILPPLLQRFLKQFPDCTLTIREDFTERLVHDVVDHSIDLAIASTPIDSPSVRVDVVGAERLLAVASVDADLPPQANLHVQHLSSCPVVVLHEMHCLGEQIEAFCSARSVIRRIVCRSTQLSTVLELVALGLGLSIVPEMCARVDRSKRRRYLALGRRGPRREISVVRHLDRTPSRLSRAFVNMLREDLTSGRHSYPEA